MWRALREGLSSLRREPLVQVVAIGTIAVSLMLVGLVRLAAANVGQLARAWGQGVQATVYLEEGVSPLRGRRSPRSSASSPASRSARAVDSHEAYQRLKQSLGDRGGLLEGVEETLMPVSIDVMLVDGAAGALRLGPEFERLRHAPGVEDVELMGDWVVAWSPPSACSASRAWCSGPSSASPASTWSRRQSGSACSRGARRSRS